MDVYSIALALAVLCAGTHAQTDRGPGDTSLGRLPLALWPIHYQLEIQPDIYGPAPPFPYAGTNQIRFECRSPTSIVYLNVVNADIKGETIAISAHADTPTPAPDPEIVKWEVDETLQFFKLFVQADLVQGAHYSLTVGFNGTLAGPSYGLYYDSYEEQGETRYLVATQFQPTMARFAFPAFDEPEYKATWDLVIVRKTGMISLANMPLNRTEPREDDWEADYFSTSPRMSSYLVAFAVCDFEARRIITNNGHEVNVWARREALVELDFALTVVGEVMDWMDNFTGVTYSLPKLDHIALPSKMGAMENWGLATYGEAWLLYDPNRDSLGTQRMIGSVIAHEVAHMWFGDLVTCRWWNDLWLNEGFASFFEFVPLEYIPLGWNWNEYHKWRKGQITMRVDDKNTTAPIRVVVDEPWNARTAFSTGAYYKGSCVLRFLAQVLGWHTFKRGINRYLTKHAYGNAVTDDFWDAMTEQAEIDGKTDTDGGKLYVKEKMDPWVDQSGYPKVRFDRQTADSAAVTQTRFLSPPGQEQTISPFNYEWYVPITMYNQENATWSMASIDYLNRENKTVSVGLPSDIGQWYFANVKGAGFYLVDYDQANFDLLAEQLVVNHSVFHLVDRSSLIHDAFKLARNKDYNETRAMEMTRYLDKEDAYINWKTTNDFLVQQSLLLRRFSNTEAKFKEYLNAKLTPNYNSLGWDDQVEDNNFLRSLRALTLEMACYCGMSECVTEAKAKYDRFMQDPDANAVTVDHRHTVYCAGIADGPEANWEFALNRYQNEQNYEESLTLRSALACPNNDATIRRYINATFDPEVIDPFDASYAINAIAAAPRGRWVLWDHLKQNWNNEPVPIGVDKLSVLVNVAAGFATDDDVTDLNDFIAQNPAQDDATRDAYEAAQKQIGDNKAWADDNEQDLLQWYTSHTAGAGRAQRLLTSSVGSMTLSHLRQKAVLDRYQGLQQI